MTTLTEILNNPEEHYPGNFDTPERAVALLTGLCQDAAIEIDRLNRARAEKPRVRDKSGTDYEKLHAKWRKGRQELSNLTRAHEALLAKVRAEQPAQQQEARIAQLEAELMRMQGRELKLQFALAEQPAQHEPVISGKWAWVPVDPSWSMLIAGNHGQPGDFSAKKVWGDMIAALERSFDYRRPIDPPNTTPQPAQQEPVAKPKLIGWRTSDYLMETSDVDKAKNWEVHYEMLPIFEGDPNTKLAAPQPAQQEPVAHCEAGPNFCAQCAEEQKKTVAAIMYRDHLEKPWVHVIQDDLPSGTKLIAAPQPPAQPLTNEACKWARPDRDHAPDTWEAACGAMWTFTEGGPKDNDMHFCPKCGKPAIEAKHGIKESA
jgi:hypothetical protein